jgi:hypothetical protein
MVELGRGGGLQVRVDPHSLTGGRSPKFFYGPTPTSLIGRLDSITQVLESRKEYGFGRATEPAEVGGDSSDGGATERAPTPPLIARVAAPARPSPPFEIDSPVACSQSASEEDEEDGEDKWRRGEPRRGRGAIAAGEQSRQQRYRARLHNRRHGRDPPKFRRQPAPRRGAVWENAHIFARANRHRRLTLSREGAAGAMATTLLPPITATRSASVPLPLGVGGGVDGGERSDSSHGDNDGAVAPDEAELATTHRFGGQAEMGERDMQCYARSVSEDFTVFCKVGALKRSHVKFPAKNPAWRAVTDRTHKGEWAGTLNGDGQWAGSPARTSQNEAQLMAASRQRHANIRGGVLATTLPGLERVKSDSLMLGHAANIPRRRKV